MPEPQFKLHQFGRCRLDIGNRLLWHEQEPVDLPPRALDLLCLLVENDGAIVSKETIWQSVWQNAFVEETNLTHTIYLLRKKFKELGEADPIRTVPRRGYRFEGFADSQGQYVLEKRAISQTLIEEIPAEPTSLPVTKSVRNWRALNLVGPLTLVVFVLGFAAWQFSKKSDASSQPMITSVAVLPFVVLNGAGANDNSGMGLTDVLITRLSNVKGLRVRPTSSVIAYAGRDAVEAGRDLDVDAVLEGMLYRQNDEIRVTTKLISTREDHVIWSGQFERSSPDELKLQNEIALKVVNVLASNLTSNERDAVGKSYTENTDAWHSYVNARFEWNKRTWPSMLEAQRLFRNAIAIDPTFALAYCGLADTIAMTADSTEASSLVDKALELDPSLAEAHASRGFIRMFHSWDWEGAEASFRRSVELNANYATAHHWYATLLAIQGRPDEAKAEMQRALELNPRSPNFLADLGQIYYFNREYDAAKEYCFKALEQDPEFVFAHEYLHDIYLFTGEYDKAVDEELMAQRFNLTFENESADRKRRLESNWQEMRTLFEEKGIAAFEENLTSIDTPAFGYLNATKFAFVGKNDKVLENLNKAYDSRAFLTVFIKADPVFDPVRNDPVFVGLLAKMRLD
jgi:DNA-binding winged helix-turn-helix (wHTH) protein/TolB-like protein